MTQRGLTTAQLQATIGAYFDTRAARFDSEPTHGLQSPAQRDAWLERVAHWVGDEPGRALLDPGCATGFFALIAAELGHRPLGIDISPAMIAEATRKARSAGLEAAFRVGDATATGLPEGSLDVVLERHLLWTVPSPLEAVRHWLRLLRPGGRLVSVGVDWRGDAASPTTGIYAALLPSLPFYGGRPAADYAALLIEAGFTGVRVESLHDDRYWLDGRNRDRFAVSGTRGV